MCIDYLRAFVNEDTQKEKQKVLKQKIFVQISLSSLLKTQRVPYSLRGKLLDTSERGPRKLTSILDVKSL